MPNSQKPTDIAEDEATPVSDRSQPTEDANSVAQNCGPVDDSIKINPEKLRRLQESSRVPDAASRSKTSAATQSQNPNSTVSVATTLYASSEASLPATTLQGSVISEPVTEMRTIQAGHGICCNFDPTKRCLNSEANDGVPDLDSIGRFAKLAEAHDSAGVIDKPISGYTGPTEVPEPATEEEREAAIKRRTARLARIQ